MAYPLWPLLPVVTLYEGAVQSAAPLLPLLLKGMGASPGLVGTVLGTAGLFTAGLAIPAGRLVDRFGSPRVLLGGTLSMAAGLMVLWRAGHPAAVVVGLTVVNLSTIVCIVAGQTYAGGAAGARERNFGLFVSAVGTGALLGPPLGGLAADYFSLRTVFLGSAAVAIMGALLSLCLPRPPRAAGHVAAAAAAGGGFWSGLAGLFAIPELRYSLAIALLILGSQQVRTSFYPLFLAEHGFSTTQIGLQFTAYGLLFASTQTVLGPIFARFGRYGLMAFAMALMSVSTVLIAPAGGRFWLQTALSAAFGLGMGVTQPLGLAILVDHVPAAGRGMALGLRMTFNRLGHAASPLVLGAVASVAGLAASVGAAACFSATACVYTLHFARRRARPPRAGD